MPTSNKLTDERLKEIAALLFLVNKKSIKNSTEFQLSPTGIPIKRQHQGGLN